MYLRRSDFEVSINDVVITNTALFDIGDVRFPITQKDDGGKGAQIIQGEAMFITSDEQKIKRP